MYKRKSTFPKQMIKIELNKAYDTINWNFLRLLMIALQFPKEYVDRVIGMFNDNKIYNSKWGVLWIFSC